jgi:hypothetical protein
MTFIQRGNVVVSVSRDRGKTFSKPVIAIDAEGHMSGGMHRGPRIGVDAKGRIVVTSPAVSDKAELKRKYPTSELFLVMSSDGGRSWSKPVQVNEVSKQAPEALHWLAVSPSGEAHVVWLDRRDREGPGQDIYYAKVIDGKVGKNVQIASVVCECCAPGLAIDAAGNPFVAFREGGQKPSREVFAIRPANADSSFGAPARLNAKPTLEEGCPMSAPSVAVSADGKKFAAAWKDLRSGKNDPHVYWAISDNPAEFLDSPIDFQPRVKQNHPTIALDESGRAWVAWEDTRSGTQRIWYRSSAESDEPQPVSELAEGEASFPSIGANGNLVAIAYEASNQGKKAIRFRILHDAAK